MNSPQLTALCLIWTLLNVFRSVGFAAGDESSVVLEQLGEIGSLTKEASKTERTVLAGKNGWLYFVPELRAISVGEFWGQEATKVSRASKAEYADPLAAIIDFHDQLQRAGIELLLVPVPAKVAIYPESLLANQPDAADQPSARIDAYHHKFYDLLRERGVEVIDLVPVFLKLRAVTTDELYCKTDSHWSGRGVTVAAEAIFERVRQYNWYKEVRVELISTEVRRITIEGDLAKMMNETNPTSENLDVTICGQKQGDQLVRIEPSRSSSILLMGDSHTLVFHDPTLFASGAGLPDHLARHLGFAVDLIGVRGSGATTTRIELLRRKDHLAGKKLVIWCFSFREFTESETGWRKVPVIRPLMD
jgi:alginate O-acetyltransferase complex protein AlgJ